LFRKHIILFILLLILISNTQAGLFGISLGGKKEYNALKKEFNETRTELNGIKKLCLNIQTDIKATAQAHIKAFAGLDQSLTQSINAGRDSINQTNDSKMITTIFQSISGGLFLVILVLLRFNSIERQKNRKYLENRNNINEDQIEFLMKHLINKTEEKKNV
jgi:hypothetical protein